MPLKPLPLTQARRAVRAARDAAGVPHVTAEDWPAALYGLGYLHALDRPTQLLFSRVVASGQAAARIAGTPGLVDSDRFFRRAGLARHLDREVALLDSQTLAQLQDYCDGVNDGLRQTGRSLPMWATGYQPSPWDPQAVLLLGHLLSFGGLIVSLQQNERILFELVQSGVDPELLRELFAPSLDDADFDLLRQIKMTNRLSDEALELIADLPRWAGSNAWAVAPARSATGHALLACDPHLEVNRLPAIWYEAVLRWGDGYVLGASLPGCPLFAVGRTSRLAWGVTYLKGDTSDFFIEDCRPEGADADGQPVWHYRREDRWVPFDVRQETIERKGGPPETLRVFENPQGTLELDLTGAEPGLYLSIGWIGQHEGVGATFSTWLNLLRQPSVREAMDLVRDCPQPTLNWVLADAEGHIGWQASGWFPRRGPHRVGAAPAPAWDPANHWQGILPTDQLPRVYDPPAGWISSANENVNRPGMQPLVTQPVAEYRKRRIEERLAALPAATVEDMQALQYDVTSLQARDLLERFLPLMPEGDLKRRLAAWDQRYDPMLREPSMFAAFYRNLLVEVFGQDTVQHGGLGWRRIVYLCTRAGFSLMVVAAVDRALKRPDSKWWAGRDPAELVRRAAERVAVEDARSWAVTNAFQFTNRFFEGRFVGRALGFHTSELPMRGCHATPFQGHLLRVATRETTFAPSYHFVADLGAREAWTNLPGGPTEHWFSRYYKADLPRWLDGRYKRLSPDEA